MAGLRSPARRGPARATGFTDIGEDIVPRDKVDVELDGYLRARADDYDNLDLDRGLDALGPAAASRCRWAIPNAQVLTGADMRLRTDIDGVRAGRHAWR